MLCHGGAQLCRMVLKVLLFEPTSGVSEIIPTTINFPQNRLGAIVPMTRFPVSGVKLCRCTRVKPDLWEKARTLLTPQATLNR